MQKYAFHHSIIFDYFVLELRKLCPSNADPMCSCSKQNLVPRAFSAFKMAGGVKKNLNKAGKILQMAFPEVCRDWSPCLFSGI